MLKGSRFSFSSSQEVLSAKCSRIPAVLSLFFFSPPYFSFSLSVVGLDIQDEMGRHEVGHIENSMKVPLNDGYGCRFEGEFSINKVRNGPRTPGFIMSPKVLLKSIR